MQYSLRAIFGGTWAISVIVALYVDSQYYDVFARTMKLTLVIACQLIVVRILLPLEMRIERSDAWLAWLHAPAIHFLWIVAVGVVAPLLEWKTAFRSSINWWSYLCVIACIISFATSFGVLFDLGLQSVYKSRCDLSASYFPTWRGIRNIGRSPIAALTIGGGLSGVLFAYKEVLCREYMDNGVRIIRDTYFLPYAERNFLLFSMIAWGVLWLADGLTRPVFGTAIAACCFIAACVIVLLCFGVD